MRAMRSGALLKVILPLLLATSVLVAVPTVYVESPALSFILGKLSPNYNASSNSLTFGIYTNDIYGYKVTTPFAPIILVDTGVTYNEYTAQYFHYCKFTGFAPTGLINWMEEENMCIGKATYITLKSLAQALLATYGTNSIPLIDDASKLFTIPQSDVPYKVCITSSTILAQHGIYVGTTTSETGDKGDTIIIFQPAVWNDDLYGHGTATASALCGKIDVPVLNSAGSKVMDMVMYTGAATGAHIYVVNVGAYAIVLPDYDISTDTVTRYRVSAILNTSATLAVEIQSERTADALATLFNAAKQYGSYPEFDYKFYYLGSALAAKDVIESLKEISGELSQYLAAENYKPIALINVAVKVNTNTTSPYNAYNLCNELSSVFESMSMKPYIIVAPTGNDFSLVDESLNKNNIYIWPAQCTYLKAIEDGVSVPNEPFQVIPVEGAIVTVSSTDNNIKSYTNVQQGTGFYGNYYSSTVDLNATDYVKSGATVVVAEPAALYGAAKIINATIDGTTYNVSATFNGIPVFYPCGSVLAIGSNENCAYGEGVVVPEAKLVGSTIEVEFSGYNGTSFAASYGAALAALATFDNPSVVSSQDAANAIASAVKNGGNTVLDFKASNVWEYLLAPTGAATGYPSSTFPYVIPANSLYLFEGAFPAGSGTVGSAMANSGVMTMPTSSSTPATTSTQTAKPEIAQVNFPGVALLAPLFSKLFARRKSKKTSKGEKQ